MPCWTSAPSGCIPPRGPGVFINVTVAAGEHTACCEIVDFHTNIVRIQKDDQILFQGGSTGGKTEQTDRSVLSVEEIIAFADCLDPADVAEVLGRQVACNSAISVEGLKGGWGAEIGRTLRSLYGDDVSVRARAAAAAGSDARMNGCEMPVVIVSGSGNQGMTASLPVIEYARDMGADDDALYRALAVSDLVTSTRRPASAACPPSAARSVPDACGGGHAPICRADATRSSPTPSPIPWPSARA